jgi:hypothetical protein
MMHFNRSFQIGALLAVTWALASGCTSTSTTPDSCVSDSTVVCSSGTGSGYSCTGVVTPTNGTLTCGNPVPESNGDSGYCCIGVSTTGVCNADASVVCSSGTGTGYSCTGSETPQQTNSTLDCGTGVAESDGDTGYCCTTGSATTDTCAVDTTVACDGSTGYSCTGTTPPDATDTTLDCGAGVSGANGTLAYCCVSLPASSTCLADSSVVGCTGGSYGFSCTSTDTPTDADSSLDCSVATAGPNGASLYCCISFSSTSSCAPDSTVVGCTGDSYGFSCTSTDTPEESQPTLNCSDPTTGPNNELLYCCQNR